MIEYFLKSCEPFVTALAGMLVHSIWQGAIAALVCFILISNVRRSSPVLRYGIMCGILTFFTATTCFTFWLLFRSQNLAGTLADNPVLKKVTGMIPEFNSISQTVKVVPENLFDIIQSFAEKNSTMIAVIWVIAFMFKTGRIAIGLHVMSRLKNQAVDVSDEWKRKLKDLAAQLDFYNPVRMICSGRVEVPFVYGFIVPVIAIPSSFLSTMPIQHIEAILLHELSHIRRNDYLVNLLQSLLESIFFFNPAVIWISGKIREEREYCCDQVVINATNNPMALVNALVAFKEQQVNQPYVVSIFTYKRNHLLDRIRRILFNNHKQQNLMEKLVLTISCIVFTFYSAAFYPVKESKHAPSKAKLTTVTSSEKPAAIPVSTVTVSLKKVPEPLVSIPKDTLPAKQELISRIRAASNIRDLDSLYRNIYALYTDVWRGREQIKKSRTSSALVSVAFKQRELGVGDELRKMQQRIIENDSVVLEENAAKNRLREEEIAQIKKTWQAAREDLRRQQQEQLVKDMMQLAGLRENEKLSFRLHNEFLIVNGEEQLGEIHTKFKEKYLVNSWQEWVYNWEGTTGYRVNGPR